MNVRAIKKYIRGIRRILVIAKKPSEAELRRVIKVAGAGMLIIGFTGVAIAFLLSLPTSII